MGKRFCVLKSVAVTATPLVREQVTSRARARANVKVPWLRTPYRVNELSLGSARSLAWLIWSMVEEGEMATGHTLGVRSDASRSSPALDLEREPTSDARMRRGGVKSARLCCTVALSILRRTAHAVGVV